MNFFQLFCCSEQDVVELPHQANSRGPRPKFKGA